MAKKRHHKKGIAMGELVTIGLMFVLIGVTIAVGAYINSQLLLAITSSTAYNNTINNATQGLANLSSWLPIIGIVIAAGVIIGVLVRSFSIRREAEGI